MNFFSPEFFAFILLILILYYRFPTRWQNPIIFLSSSVFIGLLSVKFLIYTWIFILFTYFVAKILDRLKDNHKAKKWAFNVSVAIIIGALVFFKYTNMLLQSIEDIIAMVGGDGSINLLNVIIPLGISYYTFQALGYLLQVYRGIEKSENDLLIFANYYLFFPKFLSGPIEMSKHFLPQLHEPHTFNYDNFVDGLRLMMWGAFKKIVIADRLAVIVNSTYGGVEGANWGMIFITFIVQPFHIYCDFSGYTDIALGIGRTFGFKLTDNFNRPFFSPNVTVFWQRWHISLSSWCNEFIYKRLAFKHRRWKLWAGSYAIFVTFLVVGLWHGPRWNFLILGLLQGIAINYEYFTKKWRLKTFERYPAVVKKVVSSVIVFFFFACSLVFFNAVTFNDVTTFFKGLFSNIDIATLNDDFLPTVDKVIVFFSLILLFIVDYMKERGNDLFKAINEWPVALRWLVYYVLVFMVLYMGSPTSDFVYMQF